MFIACVCLSAGPLPHPHRPPTLSRTFHTFHTLRYGMEVQRLCSVLEQHLEGKTYLVGEEYTLADMMCFPWFNMLR